MRLPDGHLVRIPHGAVYRRRPSERHTPLYIPYIIYDNFLSEFYFSLYFIKYFKRLSNSQKCSSKQFVKLTVGWFNDLERGAKWLELSTSGSDNSPVFVISWIVQDANSGNFI